MKLPNVIVFISGRLINDNTIMTKIEQAGAKLDKARPKLGLSFIGLAITDVRHFLPHRLLGFGSIFSF